MSTYLPHLIQPVHARDHALGRVGAAVTLLEYGDFECPDSGAAHPHLVRLCRQLGGGMRFVYRHFPVTATHRHAERAAEAAEAAAVQGQFWTMHDMLFDHQEALADDDLMAYAEELGLDLRRFEMELGSGVHAARVRGDFMTGVRSGVHGTPTFYINGVRHDGAHDIVSLQASIDQVLRTRG